MARVFRKRNTIWSFYPYGATKETKSSKTLFPEYRLGTPLTNSFIQELEEKEWKEDLKESEKEND